MMLSKKYFDLIFILIMGFGMSLLMTLIITYINTGMDKEGRRFPLDFTRNCVKGAIRRGYQDNSKEVLETLERLIDWSM